MGGWGVVLEITLFGEKLVFKADERGGSFSLNWFYATDSCGHPAVTKCDGKISQNLRAVMRGGR